MSAAAAGIRGDTAARRAIDVFVSTAAILLLSPVFLVIAVAIKWESSGPVFFTQLRVGRSGRSFRILKFRSMIAGASHVGANVSGALDPRVTRVGRVLRATKLDEFPQFWNVFRGDMTLIGPRAEIPEIVRHYTLEEQLTISVRPGLTCPGQLYFTTHQASELDSAPDPEDFYIRHQLHPKLALDLEYLKNRSLSADIAIVMKTLRVMFGSLVWPH